MMQRRTFDKRPPEPTMHRAAYAQVFVGVVHRTLVAHPACGAEGGPGATTLNEGRITCRRCRGLRAR